MSGDDFSPITINGQPLTEGQEMTLRAALADFAITLESGLGDDEMGRGLTQGYKERLGELYALIMPDEDKPEYTGSTIPERT